MLLILAASTLSHAAMPDDNDIQGNGQATQQDTAVAQLTAEQTIDRLRQLANSSFAEALAPFHAELRYVNLRVYDNMAANRDVYARMAEELNRRFAAYYAEAIGVVCHDLRIMGVPLTGAARERTELNWQVAASLHHAFGAEMGARLADGLLLEFTEEGCGLRFDCAFNTNDAMFAAGTREQLMTARFALAYLYTVYDDMGVRKDYETPTLPSEYLATIAHPLPGRMIKDGWYDARSQRTRLHTGTDIRASRNTEILSATDGVVLYIGFSAIPGNYVIIRDPAGYEYHYYHMSQRSKHVSEGETVRQGQAIGLVGSTGNSVANHLHLAIVTPEGAYINPYDVFVQAGIGPVRPSG